jgi:hypothetical protein
MTVFINILLPVLTVISVGLLAEKAFHWNLRSLAELALYVLTPALIFRSIYHASLGIEHMTRVAVHALLLAVVLTVSIELAARLLHQPQDIKRAVILGSTFKNTGNYGLPVIQFAFGDYALAIATPFFVTEIFLMYTLGVFVAARGKAEWRGALGRVFKMPPLYAMVAALILRWAGPELPVFAWQAVDLLAGAAIPVMLLSLGAQLANSRLSGFSWPVVQGTGIRLLLSPAIAAGLAVLMGLDKLTLAVLVVQSATPSAVVTTLFAVEYDTLPELVAMITVFTTVISFLTVTVLLSLFI